MSSSRLLLAFWFLYMGGLGLVFPYQSLYLHENAALSGTALGLVLATRPVVAMLVQPFWGVLADRTGARATVLAVATLGTALSYAVFPLASGVVALAGAMALASLFGTSVIPLATALTMASLGTEGSRRFGRVRAWGTIGFLALVIVFPPLLDRFQAARGLVAAPGGPSEPGLGLLFVGAALLSALAAPCAWALPRSTAASLRAGRGEARLLLRHRPYRRILLVTFLAFLTLQGPILLLPVLVRDHGGTLGTVGWMWVPMLLVEIPLLFLTGASLERIGVRGLVTLGALADGLRWVVCSLTDSLTLILAMQLLHGVSVVGISVGAQVYVEEVVPERLRATGQALVTTVGVSLGGALSSLAAGWLLEHAGADAPWLWGGSAALVLGASVPWLLPRPERPGDP
jgi:PPP family 3-phenylpropionic acid transporter